MSLTQEGRNVSTTYHKKHDWQLPGPTQKPKVWLVLEMTEAYVPYWQNIFQKDDIDHPMSLIRIFLKTCRLQHKVWPPSLPLNVFTPHHTVVSSSLIFYYWLAILLAVPQENSSLSHPTSCTVPYMWNILSSIQLNFEVTFSFPESVRLCFQNELGLYTQTGQL